MSGFEFLNMINYRLKDERYGTDLFPYCSHKVIAMMKNTRYMPSMGLGKKGRGRVPRCQDSSDLGRFRIL